MRILAGNVTIPNVQVYSERTWHDGAARPALRIVLQSGLSDEQLAALKSELIGLVDDEGNVMGTWADYNAIHHHEIVLVQVPSVERLEAERDAAQDAAKLALDAATLAQDTAEAMLDEAKGNARVVNAAVPLLIPWEEGVTYSSDELCVYDGVPYLCLQSHTSQADWVPDAVPAIWMQYHGTTRETARPWVAPSGAHDMYLVGEYIIWTDGKMYCCAADTTYDPATQANAWVAVEPDSAE